MSNTVIRVALVGNPNCGKTSLFNILAGANQRVGNFAGVTIEKVTGVLQHEKYRIEFTDLPGTYSLTAYSPEERISLSYIREEKPDVIINVLEGTNLERNLYLTTQLMELDVKMVLALNMQDEMEQQGIQVDVKTLQKLVGAHIVPVSAVTKFGIESLISHIIRVYNGEIVVRKNKLGYHSLIEDAIDEISQKLELPHGRQAFAPHRWNAIRLLEKDPEVYRQFHQDPIWLSIEPILQTAIQDAASLYQTDPEMMIAEDRYAFIQGALMETVSQSVRPRKSLTDRIDAVVLNRFLGLPVFLLLMYLVFQFTFAAGAPFTAMIEWFFSTVSAGIAQVLPSGPLQNLIIDGVIAGVGGVLIFLPNIVLLFIALSVLEGSGYMGRAAFVMDKVMHLVGLHGKSFIPMMTGFGCSVPAIMATRTLKNPADRLVTMMIIPFMSCGARLPVYVLLISVFFSPQAGGNVLFGIYLFGIFIALLSAKLLKKAFFNHDTEPFVMELPPYRIPTLKSVLFQARIRAQMYLKKAGTIILVVAIAVWVGTNYPKNPETEAQHLTTVAALQSNPEALQHAKALHRAESLQYSAAGYVGKVIEPIFRPLGFDWRIDIALLTGLAAKEVVVSTLSTIYAVGEDNSQSALIQILKSDPSMTRPVGLALLVFVLLYIPCFATLTVFKKESGSWKWLAVYSVYTLSVAWFSAFAVYRLALWMT